MTRFAIAALVSACAIFVAADAQPWGGGRPGPAKNFICPAQVTVHFTPANPIILHNAGWQANMGDFAVQLDPANPPHISGGNMVCMYKLLNQPDAFNLYQPVGSLKCSPVSNGTGFTCIQ